MKKEILLKEFRDKADTYLKFTTDNTKDKRKRANYINRKINELRDEYTNNILNSNKSDSDKLDNILLTAYVSYIVMLEYRNAVWEYEYMAFSRRIGEIWEPFCKIPFEFPVKELRIFKPPTFKKVQTDLKNEIKDYVSSLKLSTQEKKQLLDYYKKQSLLIGSGNINLSLDLHFYQDEKYYHVDYKSGFSSNEKGNTNRLLMVASVYKDLSKNNKNLLFIRQPEENNNHYLQTLKNSGIWEVYCADEVYKQINKFTGFDMKNWMDNNMNWKEDISPDFKNFLENNDLLKYLTW